VLPRQEKSTGAGSRETQTLRQYRKLGTAQVRHSSVRSERVVGRERALQILNRCEVFPRRRKPPFELLYGRECNHQHSERRRRSKPNCGLTEHDDTDSGSAFVGVDTASDGLCRIVAAITEERV
jgi:hypothetical protein